MTDNPQTPDLTITRDLEGDVKPKESPLSGQNNMFRSRLDQIIDLGQDKVILAEKID